MIVIWLRRIFFGTIVFLAAITFTVIFLRVGLEYFYPSLPDSLKSPVLPKTDIQPAETVLNLPVTIPVSSLRKAAEHYTPKTYTDVDHDFTDMLLDDTLNYELIRGPIDLEIKGDGIAVSFRVSGKIRAKGYVNLGVVKVKTSAHADVEGLISGTISFTILPDWRIDPSIDYRVDITKASIPIKGMGDISLRTFLEEKLSKKVQRQKKKLAEKIMDKDIIHSEVKKVWENMHQIKRISHDPITWACIVPKKVGFLPLSSKGKEALTFGMSLTLGTDILISEDPPCLSVTELPDADILNDLDERFHLFIPASADMATLNRYLAMHVQNRSFPISRYFSLSIERVDFFSPGPNLLSFSTFLNVEQKELGLGTHCRFYGHGILNYDTEAGMVSFDLVDYDAFFPSRTATVLHWIFSPYIRHTMKNHLKYPVTRDLSKAHHAINQWIETLVIPPGVAPTLVVNTPEILSLSVDRPGLSTTVRLTGKARANLTLPENL